MSHDVKYNAEMTAKTILRWGADGRCIVVLGRAEPLAQPKPSFRGSVAAMLAATDKREVPRPEPSRGPRR
jgi:hypothetical protein